MFFNLGNGKDLLKAFIVLGFHIAVACMDNAGILSLTFVMHFEFK
jgi:hypothetical protein